MPVIAAACSDEIRFQARELEESWQQSPTDQVDVLWVVDNSSSMREEQELLAAGFETFISTIEDSQADFNLGVISTDFSLDDPDRGRLLGEPAVISPVDDYIALFQERALVGVTGSGKEKGLAAAQYALDPRMTTGPNAGFLREAANLLVVFVSDEDDCSDDGALGEDAENTACYSQADLLEPVERYVAGFQALKDARSKVKLAAIVGPETPETEGCDDNTLPGRRYIEAVRLTGGLVGSICRPDWSEILFELGLRAADINDTFPLSHGAEPGTLEVLVNADVAQFLGYLGDVTDENGFGPITLEEASQRDGYVYDPVAFTITFFGEWVPERGADIVARYTIQPGT